MFSNMHISLFISYRHTLRDSQAYKLSGGGGNYTVSTSNVGYTPMMVIVVILIAAVFYYYDMRSSIK